MCLLVGAGWVVGSLSSCATLPMYETAVAGNKITVPASLFAQNNFRVIRAEGLLYNIGLRKESDDTYTALLLRCTHADNQLTPTGNGFKCSLHGSTFNAEGQVTEGPAEKPLTRLHNEVIHDHIVIRLN